MTLRRRFTTLLAACAVLALLQQWLGHGILPLSYLGRIQHASSPERPAVVLPDLRKARPTPPPWRNVYPAGKPKPAGSKYTRAVVMARVKAEDDSWLDEALGDLFSPKGLFEKVIYVADDRTAPLHPIKNKGHEAMVYLSYIIDRYDDLPEVSIFVHAERFTWHNNELMENDLAGMLRYLNPEKVIRDGYMNLRCHGDPGCPDWLHLSESAKLNTEKREEQAISQRWREIFPIDEMPKILAQPCCSQFALSKERIRAVPLQRYVHFKSWLLRTSLDDYTSGRVFEYLWQYIFTGNSVVCPSMHICYCDGYGICFENEREFDKWFEIRYRKTELQSQARQLASQQDREDLANEQASRPKIRPPSDRKQIAEMQDKIAELEAQMKKLRDDAFVRGGSSEVKAAILKQAAR